MQKYVAVYLGGEHPSSPEEGEKLFAKYKQWLESINDSVVSPANPLRNTHSLSSAGVEAKGVSGMSGYTIVEAPSIEAAIDLLKSCPFLEIGGTIEISELMSMPF